MADELSNDDAMTLLIYATKVAFDYGVPDEQVLVVLIWTHTVSHERGVEGDLAAMLLIVQEFYSIPLTDDPDELLHQTDSQFEIAN